MPSAGRAHSASSLAGTPDNEALTTPPPAIAAIPQTPSLTSLPSWQLRYLVARAYTATDNEAVRRARVSVPIVLAEASRNPAFAKLRQEAISGTLVLPPEASSRLARDGYPRLVQRAMSLAANEDPETGEQLRVPIISKDGDVVGEKDAVAYRDQAVFMRLAGETAGAIGSGAQQPATTINNWGAMILQLQQQQQPMSAPDAERAHDA